MKTVNVFETGIIGPCMSSMGYKAKNFKLGGMDFKKFNAYIGSIADIELAIRQRVAKIHEDVNQHYDEHPYFYHLAMVAENAMNFLPEILEKPEDIIPVLFASYFHDSIEDARLTYNDVKKIALEYMSEEQALLATEIVYALTNEKGRNRHERANDKYYEGIRRIPYAPMVKACDRLANYEYAVQTNSRMVNMYRKEMEDFINNITLETTDPRFHIPETLKDCLLA